MLGSEVAELKGLFSQLDTKDQGFAESLIKQFEAKGKLSSKQAYWVGKLVERAKDGGKPKETPKVELGDFKGVYDLFATASANLKYPKIRLQTEDGKPVVLSMAGKNSKVPGQINVTDGGPFGSNRWYGRVDQAGHWTQSKLTYPSIETLLKKLAQDPAKVAAEYGKLTGHCCFCRRPLDDPKSVAVGYGPVCAKHYHLPWGSKANATFTGMLKDLAQDIPWGGDTVKALAEVAEETFPDQPDLADEYMSQVLVPAAAQGKSTDNFVGEIVPAQADLFVSNGPVIKAQRRAKKFMGDEQ